MGKWGGTVTDRLSVKGDGELLAASVKEGVGWATCEMSGLFWTVSGVWVVVVGGCSVSGDLWDGLIMTGKGKGGKLMWSKKMEDWRRSGDWCGVKEVWG